LGDLSGGLNRVPLDQSSKVSRLEKIERGL
jgi:hypothetical protein